MHRNVTAIYRTHATADLVRRELNELGISHGRIHVIPDRDEAVGATGERDDHRYMDQIHDLHLPDADVRTYQHSVRRGDYVVSAEVDEEHLSRVQEIMRRPEAEAHELSARDHEFRHAEPYGHSLGTERRTNAAWVGRRDTTHDDPYTRTYERDERLEEARRDERIEGTDRV